MNYDTAPDHRTEGTVKSQCSTDDTRSPKLQKLSEPLANADSQRKSQANTITTLSERVFEVQQCRMRIFGELEGVRARDTDTGAFDDNVAFEGVELLDGGVNAYPRMLRAIASAKKHIYLEVYSFSYDSIGNQFVQSLVDAARREVAVNVVMDGWGSAFSGRTIAIILRAAGCNVRIYNRLLSLFAGRFARTHRKMLLVDDTIAFIGGINIGDENLERGPRLGWADLALELRGPPCAYLGKLFRNESLDQQDSTLQIHFSGLGEGWRLRRLYLRAISRSRHHVHMAHGYFLPDRGILRAIVAAARRGVRVQLVLAGRSDVPLAHAATRSLYRRLLRSGVEIHEWSGSVLHAKLACIDSHLLLIGSFNLDPFSLANREVLVQILRADVVKQGEAWIAERLRESRTVTNVELGTSARRWLLDPVGLLVVRIAVLISRLLAPSRRRRLWRDGSRRNHARTLLTAPKSRSPQSIGRGDVDQGPTTAPGNVRSGPWRRLRRVGTTVLGFVVLATGVAMIVLPGPAFVVIPLGLGLLASEYGWARKLLERFKHSALRFARRGGTARDPP